MADTHGDSRKGWIGVDLDGVLAEYTTWKGADHIGAPIVAMVARMLEWHASGQIVKVMTARVSPNKADSAKCREYIVLWCQEHLGFVPEITHEKDHLMVALWDDRVVQMEPNTGLRIDEKLQTRVAELERERDEAKKALEFTYCAYCGATFSADHSGSAAVSKHIAVCPDHPMRVIERERDEALERLRHYTTSANTVLKHTDLCPDCDHPGQCESCWYVTYAATCGERDVLKARAEQAEKDVGRLQGENLKLQGLVDVRDAIIEAARGEFSGSATKIMALEAEVVKLETELAQGRIPKEGT